MKAAAALTFYRLSAAFEASPAKSNAAEPDKGSSPLKGENIRDISLANIGLMLNAFAPAPPERGRRTPRRTDAARFVGGGEAGADT